MLLVLFPKLRMKEGLLLPRGVLRQLLLLLLLLHLLDTREVGELVGGCQREARWQGCLTLLLSVPTLRGGWHIPSVNVISKGCLRVHGVAVLVHELVDVHETSSHTDDDALVFKLYQGSLAAKAVNTIALTLQAHQMNTHLQRGRVDVFS